MIYFLQADGIGHVKIGFTDQDQVGPRIDQLRTASPVPLKLLGATPGTLEDEKNLHRRFAADRVHGEWFRPTPELLAVIGVEPPPTCGPVEVAEKSVTIRVLTVGRRQFTKALLDQLPGREVIDWQNLVLYLTGDPPFRVEKYAPPEDFRLEGYTSGEVWGWVKGGHATFDEDCPEDQCGFYRWIIHTHRGTLYKHCDFDRPPRVNPGCRPGHYTDRDKREYAVWQAIYPLRLNLRGWREVDQLFFGV